MKYKLTENSIEFNNKTLFQIQALKDFGDVKAGDLGGYIEKELNLSQGDYCWLFGNLWASNDCKIYNNGKVYDCIKVYDYNNHQNYDYVKVYDNAKVSGNDDDKLKINQEDKQDIPKHYDLKIQPIDYIIANKLDFAEGNIIKYVSRYKQKNGKEDLLKARYYLDLLIKEIGE